MDMDRVGPSSSAVLELPDLDGAAGDVGQNAVVDIVEADTVDTPLSVSAVELKMVRHRRARRSGEVNRGQGVRNCRRVRNGGRRHDETHHLVRVQVIFIGADIFGVPESNVLAGKGSEVEDYLVALRHADVQGGSGSRAREETCVRGDDLERDLGGGTGLALEIQQKCARNGGIEEAEAVLAGLHVEVGPRLAVDVNDVAI